MTLYDLHTHSVSSDEVDGFDTVNIVSISPELYLKTNIESISYSCGIHPWDTVRSVEQSFSLLQKVALMENVAAIGEVGLDMLRGGSMDYQERVLRLQIELAKKCRKPLIFHCVKSWDKLMALYKEYKPTGSWIIHGFRGKPQHAEQLLSLGFHLSFGKNHNGDTLKIVPLDRLFVETDASTSASILSVYENISSVIGLPINELVSVIGENIRRVFPTINNSLYGKI